MSRPSPTILRDFTDRKTYKSTQVLKTDAIYAVYDNGSPINLRTLNALVDYPGPKYLKTAFASPGHAFNLAKKLNELFKTEDFEVFRLTGGERIVEKSGRGTTLTEAA